MRWQMTKGGEPTSDPLFDDGIPAQPGDENFTTDAVKAHVQSLGGAADGFNYVGLSEAV